MVTFLFCKMHQPLVSYAKLVRGPVGGNGLNEYSGAQEATLLLQVLEIVYELSDSCGQQAEQGSIGPQGYLRPAIIVCTGLSLVPGTVFEGGISRLLYSLGSLVQQRFSLIGLTPFLFG